MALFTDTVTVYTKESDTEWKRTVVEGVQWADKTERTITDGVMTVIKYAAVTFPKGTYEPLTLTAERKEDCILHGRIEEEINGQRGSRISNLLEKYPKSGLIKSVNDNSNRTHLPHIKVVVA